MPNFVWPPPFLPPPIPIQPPPVAMPDLHFFPIPPHPGMAVVGAPVPLPSPMQTKEPTSAAVPLAPTFTPAGQHKPIETGYHTMTTTTFIPVGTLPETCYQKLDKPMVKDEATHSIVTNNLKLNTSEKPPAAEPGKKTEKSTLPPPIPIRPQAPVQKKQREERYYHHHTHCYTNPAVTYDRAGRKEVSSPSTKEEECNSGHIKTQEKQKESEVTKGQANCEAPAELKALEKEGKTKLYSSESNHLNSEAVKPNDHHHHYYYTQGCAYPFPSPISAQPNPASQTEHQTTLQTLAEMQDAIRNLQLAQAALTSRVTEVDHEVQSSPSKSQISPENVHHGPELDAGFHITAAGYENAKPEKPKATSPEATPPVQPTNPTNGPAEPTLPESRYRVPCPHGCAPFPHEDLGPPYYMQFPRPFGGLPPHQPGFNYSAAYQAAGGNSPGYTYTQGGSYPGITMNPNNRVPGRSRRNNGHKRTYGESEDSSSEGESYYSRAPRSASVGEYRSRGHQTVRPEPKSPPPKQDEISSKAPNLEARKTPRVAFSIPVSTQSNINPCTPNLLSTSSSSSSSYSSSCASPSSSSSSSSSSDSEGITITQGGISNEKQRKMKSTDRSESGSGINITCRDKTATVESTVALAQKADTNVAAKSSGSMRAGAVKVQSELEDPTEETQVATEVSASGQNGKLTTEPYRSGVAVETDLQINIASISGNKIPEPTFTREPTAHPSVSEQPPAPRAPPPKNVTIIELENDKYISGEESNTEGLDAGQSQMDEKSPVTPLLVSIAQNKHKHRCDCQCCEERREKRGKRKDTGKEKGGKKREKSKKKSSKKKHIDSGCHIGKIERVPAAGALFQVHEKKFAESTESRGSILRDMALGACAGGLGYLVGTMVNRKQTKKEEKKSNSPFKLFGIGMSKIAGEEVAHKSAQKPEVSDNDGIYKLSEIPRTPAPPEGYVFRAANAKPVYPGWNDELPNLVASESVSSPTGLKQARAGATAAHPERLHRHRHHHHREYHENKNYKQEAGTYSADLPKETLLELGGEGENKEINVNLVIHMKNAKGEWVAMEKGRQGGSAASPVVANSSHASGAFMCGALHGFTVDHEALSPPGKLVVGTTTERKKAPYPPAVYIESDVSELSTPPFLPGKVYRYSDVSDLESPFLPTATPPGAFPPPHNQCARAQPQPSKITDLPSSPRQHDRRRVFFQPTSVRKKHQKQTFELPPDSDESEWWRSGGSGAEGGVELNTRKGMGVVDPPLRRRI